MDCAYCNYEAKGLDEDGQPTCGSDLCTPVRCSLPNVIETSSEDDEVADENDSS